MDWMKIFSTFTIVSTGMVKAAADGKVTVEEGMDIIKELLRVWGLDVAVEMELKPIEPPLGDPKKII